MFSAQRATMTSLTWSLATRTYPSGYKGIYTPKLPTLYLATDAAYMLLITPPAGAVAKYCDEYVCLSVCVSVCLSVRKDTSRTARAIFTKFFVNVAYVRGSVFFQYIYDRPHRLSRLSPGRGFLLQLKWIIGQERRAQRRRSMLSTIVLFSECQCVVVNVQQCSLLHGYAIPA